MKQKELIIPEKQHFLQILKQVKSAVGRGDTVRLKSLSNKTLHTASIEQDPNSIALAVIIYSLGKIIERKRYTHYKEWPRFYKNYLSNIDKAIKGLEENNSQDFENSLSEIRKEINKLSGRFKEYIQDVFRKAEINKASRLYEHGISMEQTAGLLGITLWELSEFTGQTGISDVNLSVTLPIKQRLKTAQEMFE